MNQVVPCEETGDQSYTGRTLTGRRVSGEQTSYLYAIILCPNQWTGTVDNQEIKVAPTLDVNYPASVAAGKKYAYPPDYNSASGILVHEMMHMVGRTRGTQCNRLLTC